MTNFLIFYWGTENITLHFKYTIIWRNNNLSGSEYSPIGLVVKFKIMMKVKRIFAKKSDLNWKTKKVFPSLKLPTNPLKLVEANWPWDYSNFNHPSQKKYLFYFGSVTESHHKTLWNFSKREFKMLLNQEILICCFWLFEELYNQEKCKEWKMSLKCLVVIMKVYML